MFRTLVKTEAVEVDHVAFPVRYQILDCLDCPFDRLAPIAGSLLPKEPHRRVERGVLPIEHPARIAASLSTYSAAVFSWPS